jgi:peptidoglycan/xylan/chitin deacetylase (PgdA/CDA1 family)
VDAISYSKAKAAKALADGIVEGDVQKVIENSAIEQDIQGKVAALETQYSPRLTGVEAFVGRPLGLVHRNSALFDTDFVRQPLVSFVIDDGGIEDLTHYKPLFDEFGYKFTMAIITGYVGGLDHAGHQTMTWGQIRQLYNEGHTVASHTVTHRNLTQITLAEAELEIRNSRDELLKRGFEVRHLMYPYGATNDDVQALAVKYYLSAATTQSTYAIPGNRKDRVPRYSIGAREMSQMKGFVDTAKAGGKWLIFYTHGYEATPEHIVRLRELLQYITDAEVPVVTYDEGYDYYVRVNGQEVQYARYTINSQLDIPTTSAHVTYGMPVFGSSEVRGTAITINNDDHYVAINKNGVYLVEYSIPVWGEPGLQGLFTLTTQYCRLSDGTLTSAFHRQETFHVFGGYKDAQYQMDRAEAVKGHAIMNVDLGSIYSEMRLRLNTVFKGQTRAITNYFKSDGAKSHLTISRIAV